MPPLTHSVSAEFFEPFVVVAAYPSSFNASFIYASLVCHHISISSKSSLKSKTSVINNSLTQSSGGTELFRDENSHESTTAKWLVNKREKGFRRNGEGRRQAVVWCRMKKERQERHASILLVFKTFNLSL
jgi:hypothetical protein